MLSNKLRYFQMDTLIKIESFKQTSVIFNRKNLFFTLKICLAMELSKVFDIQCTGLQNIGYYYIWKYQ